MARRPQKARHDLVDANASTFNFPAVSVIIPLYNVERYIGECLDSLLNQTFQNFEVILVDDCSTDSSPGIVENYAPRFNGRLKLQRMRRKSVGGGYAPRNRGVELSCGKYIFFLDADDTITPTALAELYKLAEEFQADVVHCEKFYTVPDNLWHNEAFRKQMKPYTYLTGEQRLVKEPWLWVENFEERAKFFAQRKLPWNIWSQLVRRDFILDNELKVPDAIAQDMTFTICGLCSAKRYVVVPNVVNYYRNRSNSVSSEQINLEQLIHKWIWAAKRGVNFIDGFWNEREPFTRRPDLRYLLLEMFAEEMLKHLIPVYAQIPAPALDELLRKEFAGGDATALTTFLFSKMNIQRLQLMQAHQRLHALENELQRVRAPKQE